MYSLSFKLPYRVERLTTFNFVWKYLNYQVSKIEIKRCYSLSRGLNNMKVENFWVKDDIMYIIFRTEIVQWNRACTW